MQKNKPSKKQRGSICQPKTTNDNIYYVNFYGVKDRISTPIIYIIKILFLFKIKCFFYINY